MLWVVIPAAGESKRFRDRGYTTPKPLLQIRDRNGVERRMIDHVLATVPKDCGKIVAFPKDLDLGWTVTVPIQSTKGQADTVRQSLNGLVREDSILTLDCDVILDPEDLKRIIFFGEHYDVVVAVVRSDDANMSRVDDLFHPTRFVEKQMISPFGIVGARFFKSAGVLRDCLDRYLNSPNHGEYYLTPAMNDYPGTKTAMLVSRWQDWGTPEKLEQSGAKIIL